MRRSQEADGLSNNYITRCHRQLVGVSCSWSSSCSSRQWEPASSRGIGPSGPPVEQPSGMRKKCCYSQRNLGSVCCRLFSLQLTSHTQPFRHPFATLSNKVWEVYISKEVCSFIIIVDYVSAYICIRIVVSRLMQQNWYVNASIPPIGFSWFWFDWKRIEKNDRGEWISLNSVFIKQILFKRCIGVGTAVFNHIGVVSVGCWKSLTQLSVSASKRWG